MLPIAWERCSAYRRRVFFFFLPIDIVCVVWDCVDIYDYDVMWYMCMYNEGSVIERMLITTVCCAVAAGR
jgi:hypothetical protein